MSNAKKPIKTHPFFDMLNKIGYKVSLNGFYYFATLLPFHIFVLFMSRKINWDALGIGASLACAIHCALLPLFISSLPLFGINIVNNKFFEAGMILLALAVGSYSLYHGYKKHHHSIIPLLLFFTGFLFLVSKEFLAHYATWLLIPAVVLIITAHLYNYRFCRVHNHAHAEDCNH